jgi:hypothetical protein
VQYRRFGIFVWSSVWRRLCLSFVWLVFLFDIFHDLDALRRVLQAFRFDIKAYLFFIRVLNLSTGLPAFHLRYSS